MSIMNLNAVELFRRMALSVGEYCSPNYDATALMRDGDSLIVVGDKANEQPAVRITPDGKFTTTFPGPHNSSRWISIIGHKMDIDDILIRRSVSLGAHSAIRFKNQSEVLSTDTPGEITGELLAPSSVTYLVDNELQWYSIRLKLLTFPTPVPKTYDKTITREALRKIREQWRIHTLTRRVLGDKEGRNWTRRIELKYDRNKRAQAMINLSYDDFITIDGLYSTVDTAISSCNTEIYSLVGA